MSKIALDADTVVLDLDLKNGKDGGKSLAAAGIELRETLRQKTPTGGEHHFYRVPYPVRNAVALLSGVDVKTAGGYVVGEGSVTEAGTYKMLLDEVRELPPSILALLKKAEVLAPASPQQPTTSETAQGRGLDHVTRVPPAGEGERNAAAYRHACQLKEMGNNEAETG